MKRENNYYCETNGNGPVFYDGNELKKLLNYADEILAIVDMRHSGKTQYLIDVFEAGVSDAADKAVMSNGIEGWGVIDYRIDDAGEALVYVAVRPWVYESACRMNLMFSELQRVYGEGYPTFVFGGHCDD